jgi:hypothetical protein
VSERIFPLNYEIKKPTKNERKSMNNQFDELTKSMAQSVTRRAALKKFGVGVGGMALACFGLAKKAEAGKVGWCLPGGSRCCKDCPPCCHGGCANIGPDGHGICKG